jgi:hypothetical protein
MVRSFLEGPLMQRDPTNAAYWLEQLRPTFDQIIRWHDLAADEDEDGTESEERLLVHGLDKMLYWVLGGVPALGPDEAAARDALRPYFEIVQREGRRLGMHLLTSERRLNSR